MIPNNENYEDEFGEELETDFELETEPSRTYAMVLADKGEQDNFFLGFVNDEEAKRQAILKIINTERYEHEIYSWDYGIELADLFGEPIPYVMSVVKSRIIDAITADDRFDSVENFEMEMSGKHMLHIVFTVITADDEEIEGIETEVEV